MEKILLAVDGTQFNKDALHFACWLGTLTGSKITAIFLENKVIEQEAAEPALQYYNRQTHAAGKANTKKEIIEKNISFFKETCQKNANRYTVCRTDSDPAKKIIAETRYADILVIDPGISFSRRFESIPTSLVTEVFKKAECPVIVAPASFDGIDEIIFTYNGSQSSMFAIKQFCYLFPRLDEKKVSLVQVDEDGHGTEKESQRLKEWLSSHYSSIGYVSLSGDTEIELMSYLLKKKNAFIIMGAYGRNALSQFFKHSRAECLVEIVNQAIFIAHC